MTAECFLAARAIIVCGLPYNTCVPDKRTSSISVILITLWTFLYSIDQVIFGLICKIVGQPICSWIAPTLYAADSILECVKCSHNEPIFNIAIWQLEYTSLKSFLYRYTQYHQFTWLTYAQPAHPRLGKCELTSLSLTKPPAFTCAWPLTIAATQCLLQPNQPSLTFTGAV